MEYTVILSIQDDSEYKTYEGFMFGDHIKYEKYGFEFKQAEMNKHQFFPVSEEIEVKCKSLTEAVDKYDICPRCDKIDENKYYKNLVE